MFSVCLPSATRSKVTYGHKGKVLKGYPSGVLIGLKGYYIGVPTGPQGLSCGGTHRS
jgi:hypothetical protein